MGKPIPSNSFVESWRFAMVRLANLVSRAVFAGAARANLRRRWPETGMVGAQNDLTPSKKQGQKNILDQAS